MSSPFDFEPTADTPRRRPAKTSTKPTPTIPLPWVIAIGAVLLVGGLLIAIVAFATGENDLKNTQPESVGLLGEIKGAVTGDVQLTDAQASAWERYTSRSTSKEKSSYQVLMWKGVDSPEWAMKYRPRVLGSQYGPPSAWGDRLLYTEDYQLTDATQAATDAARSPAARAVVVVQIFHSTPKIIAWYAPDGTKSSSAPSSEARTSLNAFFGQLANRVGS